MIFIDVNVFFRFNKQNKQLRFGSFKFGPIVMRMFHILNQPQLAMKVMKVKISKIFMIFLPNFQCFQDQENFDGFFDQLITFQIYLDLLYNNEMYNEVLVAFKEIEQKQLEGALFPRNSFILALAACYKLVRYFTFEHTITTSFIYWEYIIKKYYFSS